MSRLGATTATRWTYRGSDAMNKTWTRYSELLKWAVLEKRRKGASQQQIEDTYGVRRNILSTWETVPHKAGIEWIR